MNDEEKCQFVEQPVIRRMNSSGFVPTTPFKKAINHWKYIIYSSSVRGSKTANIYLKKFSLCVPFGCVEFNNLLRESLRTRGLISSLHGILKAPAGCTPEPGVGFSWCSPTHHKPWPFERTEAPSDQHIRSCAPDKHLEVANQGVVVGGWRWEKGSGSPS